MNEREIMSLKVANEFCPQQTRATYALLLDKRSPYLFFGLNNNVLLHLDKNTKQNYIINPTKVRFRESLFGSIGGETHFGVSDLNSFITQQINDIRLNRDGQVIN